MEISTLQDEGSFARFVAAFERGELPRPLWTHGAHVAIAALYLQRHGDNVLAMTRAAIRRHNRSVGTPESAYHETLTIFWLGAVDDFLSGVSYASELEAVRLAVAKFGERRKLHEDYYSFDVVGSAEARGGWVAPDVRRLKIRFILTGY